MHTFFKKDYIFIPEYVHILIYRVSIDTWKLYEILRIFSDSIPKEYEYIHIIRKYIYRSMSTYSNLKIV